MKTHLPGKIKISVLLILLFTIFFASSHAQVIQRLKDLRAGNSFPFDFTISGTKLFFIAYDDTNIGLWVTDGSAAGTIKLTPSTGAANGSFDIVAYNNKVYFSYNNGVNGYELWESDGTIAGTGLFKDLYTGSNNSFPRYFTVANNKLFFMADNIDGERRMFVSDGTAAGTSVVKNNYTSLFNGLSTFAILNSSIYFISDNGTGTGNGLWKSDGTLAGTVLVKPNIISTSGGNYAVLGNTLFFNADDGIHGSELWTSDGTTAGTNMIINLRADGGGIFYSGAPFNMITFNNKVYFTASDDTHGAELFSSDGTAPGTQIVKDLQPGPEGSVPQQSVIFNGNLYFSCYIGNAAVGLWKSDGSSTGTTLLKQGGAGTPFLRDTKFAPVFNGKLYFIVNDQQYYPLWETDGTTAGTKQTVFQNIPYPAFSTPIGGLFSFALYSNELYFAGACSNISPDIEPCKITTGVLPVTWLGIQAQWVNGNEAIVSWQLTDQINVKDYVLQHSVDGSSFTNSCTVNASSTTAYSCIIPASKNIKNYYRVMQRDIDGKATFSKIVLLQALTSPELRVYPNPAKDKLYIDGLAAGTYSIEISDASGKLIKKQNVLPTQKFIVVSMLPAAVYMLTIKSNDTEKTIKFIKN